MNVSLKGDVCDSRHVVSSETQQESQVLDFELQYESLIIKTEISSTYY